MSDDKFDKTIDHEDYTPAPRKWNRTLVIGGIAAVALAGLGVAGAMSSDYGPGRMGMGGHHGPRMMERVFDEIDATPEQQEQLRTIMRSTRNEVEPIFDRFRDSRTALADILAGATVDRAAAETLRVERLADIDAASQKITAAALQAAEVLTPEQRAELREHLQERGHGRRW